MELLKNELNEDTGVIFLYGEVSDETDDGKIGCKDVVQAIEWMSADYKNVIIRINSIGGAVYPGIAIFNAIKQSTANVTIHIDGIAASIAAVIALCGKRVEMSQYSRLMIHSVSAEVCGNKKDLEDTIRNINSLEDTLGELIAMKCGKSKEEVKTMYFDGSDHWFTANEALGLNLIDGIYDADPVPDNSTTDDIYHIFTNRLKEHYSNKKSDDMKLEDLKKTPRFANCATEEEVINVMNETAAKADKADELEKENGELKKVIEENDNAVIDAAVKEGKIDAAQKETYTNLLKSDRANTLAAVKAMRSKVMVQDVLKQEPEKKTCGAWEQRMQEIAAKKSKK